MSRRKSSGRRSGYACQALASRHYFRRGLRFELLEDRAFLSVAAPSGAISPVWFETLSNSLANSEQSPGSLPTPEAQQIDWHGQAVEAQADEWIVQLSRVALAGIVSVSDAASLFVDSGISVVRGLGNAGQILVRAVGGTAAAVEAWLANNSAIDFFEPNFVAELTQIPNDTSFAQLWGLHNTGQSGGTVDADIDAPEAWDIVTGSANVVVGVIDTGVDFTHADLAANIWTNPGEIAGNLIDDDANGFVDDVHGYDFVNNDGNPMDDHNHGTHVSGTIAGVGNNGLGVAGVNWSSSIMALKFLSAGGSGSTSDAVRAVNYATMMRSTYGVNVRVTSNSWGGGGFSQALYDAIAASGAAGMLFVAAAGNSSRNTDVTPHYPSTYALNNLIAVAATDRNDQMASFSNYGAVSVDLAAPGVSVYSTIAGGGYTSFNGTSMATPHVAGAVALAWSNASGATPEQVRDAVLTGVDALPALTGKSVTGGRLNVRGMLNRMGMTVAVSTPVAGAILSNRPTDFTLDFTHNYDLSTVQASDLSVNGLTANGFVAIDANTVTFQFNVSPVSSDGPQVMEIAAGSIHRSPDGNPIAHWQNVFYYDSLAMAVLSSSPAQGETLVARPGQIVLDFNEPIDPASVGVADLVLSDGVVTDAIALDSDSVSYTVSNLLREGATSFTLKSGALLDIHGVPGPLYSGSFVVDDPFIERFESTDVPIHIVDLATVSSSLIIGSLLTIADLDVELSLTHTADSDLDVFLVAPDGTRIELFTDVGGSGDHFLGTTLDDAAATPIASGNAPFTGRFRPEGLLSAVDGYNALGTWTLQITDDLGQNVGDLTQWALIVTNVLGRNPRINSVQPLPFTGEDTWASITSLAVRFSEVMDAATVNDSNNWQLTGAGPDGAFDTLDDVDLSLSLSPAYADGIIANLAVDAGPLPVGRYRLTGVSGGLRDLAGNALDGNGDEVGGDNFVRYFTVKQPVTSVPFLEGFEAGSLAALGGYWQFTAGTNGRIDVSSTQGPYSGSYHLLLDQTAANAGPQYATLHLDLAGRAGLNLDFWQKEIGSRAEGPNDGVQISPNGQVWYELVRLTGANSETFYQHHALSLDAAIAAAGFTFTRDFQIRFGQDNYSLIGSGGFAFDDIRISQLDVIGPKAVSHMPTGQAPAPVGSFTVTFDEPIDAATFTAADVRVTGPVGNIVTLAGDPTDSGDHRTFTINLSAGQSIAGAYKLRVGSDVRDLAGNPMNQDGDTLAGETSGADEYVGTFQIGLSAPQPFPYTQDFESGDFGALAGWSFAVSGASTIVITTANMPHGGSNHLKFDPMNQGETQQATLILDLSSQTGQTDLELDFWLQTVGGTGAVSRVDVDISGEGNSYVPLPQGSALVPPSLYAYSHFAFDLDAALSAAGIAIDGDVYVRFTHTGTTNTRDMTLDDLRIGNLDVFGPKVVSHAPTDPELSQLSTFSVTFDEPIDSATFTAGDVLVVPAGGGGTVALAGDPVDSGDHRTFTINLAATQVLAGSYTFRIGPDVRDLAGNPMNQDSDPVSGEGSQDRYVGTFQVGPATPQSFPYAQGFELDAGALAGWRFVVAGTSKIVVTTTDAPHSGTRHLKFDREFSDTRQAILLLDLSSQAGQSDLALDFWLQSLNVTATNYMDVHVSGDGSNYVPVPLGSNLTPSTVSQYRHFAFDLDAALSSAGIALDGDVYLRFTHTSVSSTADMTLDDVRITDFDDFGPSVLSHAPLGQTPGPVSSLTVIFDEAIDAATFTAADVTITGPLGAALALTGDPVDNGDHRTFVLNLSPGQTVAGAYNFRVGPDIRDLAGNLMNQDQDPVSGETNGQDQYLGTFQIGPPAPQSFPYTQDFESANFGALAGWSFAVTGTGTIEITNSDTPHGGAYHLKFDQTTQSTQQAVLLLDLSSQAGQADLVLDFWLQLNFTSTNYLDLHVSGDGSSYVAAAQGNALAPSPAGQYAHYAFDLDAVLSSAGIALDGDVYLRFTHTGSTSTREMTLDDLRISNLDVFGPEVLSQTPIGQVPAPVSSFTVTFDEPMDAATFTAADVTITGPAVNAIALAGNPVDSGDHRTFTINLSSGQALAGNYTVRIGPDVRDLAGNPMNQDNDPVLGEANGEDAYLGTFQISLAAQSFPYTQGFESGPISSLAGWNFALTGTSLIQITNTNSPHGGTSHLRFDSDSTTTQRAVLLLDLSNQAGQTDLELDFWLQAVTSIASSNYMDVHVSGDGVSYLPVPQGANLTPPAANQYTHYAFDLDAALSGAGIGLDSDVFVRFTHVGTATRDMTLDDVRISNLDVFGPKGLSHAADSTSGPVYSFTVTFDEAIDAAMFTAADVTITGPAGNAIAPAGSPVDSGDHHTFTINLAAPQILGGVYSFRIGPDVRDLAGNPMNQDNDVVSGETGGQDNYVGTFHVGPPPPQSFPYVQGFESGDVGTLAGWGVAITDGGTVQVTGATAPHSGTYHLKFDHAAASTQAAVLVLDLSSQAGATDLELDFWLKALWQADGNNRLNLYVGGDGSSFVPAPQASNLFPPAVGQYTHFGLDLDAMLSGTGIALDGDVYLWFMHVGSSSNTDMFLDDVRISNVDVFGPRVLSHAPLGQVSGPVGTITITFDESIDTATLTVADVTVTGPVGNVVALTGNPVDTGDHRTFTLNLAAAPVLAGTYTVRIGYDVRDLSGNPLNQDGDAAIGESNAQDGYVGRFQIGPVTPQSIPYTQDFESGSINLLAGWSFAVTGSGTTEVTNANSPHSGNYHVQFDQATFDNTTQDVVLAMDLSNQAGATDLSLDFWLQAVSFFSGTNFSVLVSGDGALYVPIGSPLQLSTVGRYTHFAYDLDAILVGAGVALDTDVFLTFRHNSWSPLDEMTLDDVRIRTGPINNAPTLTTINVFGGGYEEQPQIVTYAALAAAANEADLNGHTISFRIEAVSSGTLTKGGAPVAPGVTLLAAGEQLVWTPALNDDAWSGVNAFLVRAWDGELDSGTPVQVKLAVAGVNDPPSFNKGADQTANEDAAAQTVSNWATSISKGPPSESWQSVTFLATNGNPGLFSVQPAISASGTLTYTPASSANGATTVTVILQDNGGTGNDGVDTAPFQTFVITINPLNDAPLLDNSGAMRLQPIIEGDTANGGTLVSALIASAGGNRITEVDAGPLFGIAVTNVVNTNGVWEYSVDNGTNWADFGAPTNSMARLLAADGVTRVRLVPAGNFTGTIVAGITFRAWDRTGGGISGDIGNASTNGGVSPYSTATETAGITVNPLTGPPIVDAGGPYAVLEGATISLWGWGTSAAPLDFSWDLDGDGEYGETGADAVRGDETGLSPAFNAAGLDGPLSVVVSFRASNIDGVVAVPATININNSPPTANAGAPYSVVGGAAVVLDRAWAGDLAGDLDPLTLTWDLDGDGAFGETGAGAARGIEIGLTPIYNAAGLPLGSRNISFRANDGDGGITTASTTINVISSSSPRIVDNSDATGFTLSGDWAGGNGWGIGYRNSVYVAFGEPWSTDVSTWTFNLSGPGRYRVSATWFTNTGFPQLFADAARYEVSDLAVGVVRGTALINQKQVPNDFTDAGMGWEDLGSFDIVGSTLQVKLYSMTDNQTYVVADAIRIIKVAGLSPAAEIQVIENGVSPKNVADGTGNVDFGTAEFNLPVVKTFTISNSGTAPLTLPGPVSVTGSVFSVAAQPALTTLAPGQSMTFAVQMNATAPGGHSATVSFANSDGNEGPFDFTVSGTVLSTRIIDDGDPEYSQSPPSSFGFLAGPGRRGDHRYTRFFTGSDIAAWTFHVTPGRYRVSATWFGGNAGYDSTAQFTVFDGAVLRGGKGLNQQLSPDDRFVDGSLFEDVGVFNILGDALTVQLRGDDPLLFVLADAILIERLGDVPAGPEVIVLDGDRDASAGTIGFGTVELNHPASVTFTITNSGGSPLNLTGAISVPAGYTVSAPPALSTLDPGQITTFTVRLDADLPGTYAGQISIPTDDPDENLLTIDITGAVLATQVLDDGQPGYSHTFDFQSAALPVARDGDVGYVFFQAAPSEAFWTFTVMPGQYRIAATWFDTAGNAIFASIAPFTILDGTTPVATVLANQQLGPNDFIASGSSWEFLGAAVNIFSTSLTVRLTNVGADGYVLADAIRLERLGPTNGNAESGSKLLSGSTASSTSVAEPNATATGALHEEQPQPSVVDEALSATFYWTDELDDLATAFTDEVTSSTSNDMESDLAIAGRLTPREDESLDLALADWLD